MKVETPSLRRSFSWMFAGNILYAACLWGILSAMAKLGSPELVGRYALASAVATPPMLLAFLQLRPILATDSRNHRPFGEYLALRMLALPLAYLVIVAIALWGYSGGQLGAILIFGIIRAIDGLSDIFHGYVQREERIDLMARSLAFKGLAALTLFVTVYILTDDLLAALAGQAAAGLIVFLAWDLPRGRALARVRNDLASMRPRWTLARLRALAWLALPLGLAMMFIQLRNTIPRLILERECGEAELGLFAAMAYLIIVGNTVVMAMSQSSLARLSRAYAADDAAGFSAVVKKMVGVGVLLGLAGVMIAAVAGDFILTLLYDADYAGQGGVFLVVMAAGGLYYVGTMLGPPATATGAFREQLVIQGVHALLLLVSGFLLVPGHGMLGVAWTMVLGAVFVTIAYGIVAGRAVNRMKARSAI